jgi:hypothetical protein
VIELEITSRIVETIIMRFDKDLLRLLLGKKGSEVAIISGVVKAASKKYTISTLFGYALAFTS